MVIIAGSRLVDVLLQSLPPHHVLFSVCLRLCPNFSLMKTIVTGFILTLMQYDLILLILT